jgi:hypothetical protein
MEETVPSDGTLSREKASILIMFRPVHGFTWRLNRQKLQAAKPMAKEVEPWVSLPGAC